MLAIVIPFYKMAFFEETLNSLSQQKNKNFTLYVGNDASPEDPEFLIRKHEKNIAIVYQHFENNLGGTSLVQQWERCLDMVQEEEWIMILGDDDVLDSNVVKSWYDYYENFQKNHQIVRFASRIINEDSEFVSEVFVQPTVEKAEDSFYRKFMKKTRSSLSEYVFLRDAFERNGFSDYPLAWHSDDRAWLDFSENKPIYSINKAQVYIRNSNFNISGRTDNFEQKNMATYLFLKDIIGTRLDLFEKREKLFIMRAYESILEKTESSGFVENLFLLCFYVRLHDKHQLQKFLKRILKRLK